MRDPIERQEAIDALAKHLQMTDVPVSYPGIISALTEWLNGLSPAQPEQRVEELLPDGTLHLFTDTDLFKVNRVLVSQNNTHYGDLYYADEDPKRGKWIPCGKKLPKIGKEVLLSESNTMFIAEYHGSGDPEGLWLVDGCHHYLADVNECAWMPLPEPYKERRKE